MEVVFDVGTADRDSQEVFQIILKAYECEIGDTGIQFKAENRLKSPLDDGLDESYANGQIITARRSEDSQLVGVVVWSLAKSSSEV